MKRLVVNLTIQKPQPQSAPSKEEGDSVLSFVPKGPARSAAEYFAALLPGTVLLFAFYLAAEVAVVLIGGNNESMASMISTSFIPVICIMPIISGVVSTLVLEKLRKKPLTMKRGAMVGAASGIVGALASVFMLAVVALFAHMYAFGSALTGILFYVVLLVLIPIEGILGALGGAAVVKFIKEA